MGMGMGEEGQCQGAMSGGEDGAAGCGPAALRPEGWEGPAAWHPTSTPM